MWAIDAVKSEDIKERQIKEMLINYDAEVMPGDTVRISRVRIEDGDNLTYYITGIVADKQNFSVKLLF
jgi:acyl-ACP thioesterase